MKILVVGGAGYIGSHMVKQLALAGNDVITLDNLSYGYRDAVKYGAFIEGDLGDNTVLDAIFKSGDIDAVMHFAGFIQVGESVIKPAMYYLNNVVNTHTLLDAMLRHNVMNFIFSSTAAIFGEPNYTPIDEKHHKQREEMDYAFHHLEEVPIGEEKYYNVNGFKVRKSIKHAM